MPSNQVELLEKILFKKAVHGLNSTLNKAEERICELTTETNASHEENTELIWMITEIVNTDTIDFHYLKG